MEGMHILQMPQSLLIEKEKGINRYAAEIF